MYQYQKFCLLFSKDINIPEALWHTDEIIVLLYFWSRNVSHKVCHKLIKIKCKMQRDLTDIHSKLTSVQIASFELWNTNTQQWNVRLINQWLLEQDAAKFSYLISFEWDNQQLVSKVSSRTGNWMKHFKV